LSPLFIRLDEGSRRMFVVDRRTFFKVFDLNGRFLESILVRHIQNIYPSGDGNFFAIIETASKDEMNYTHLLCRVDPTGKMITKIAEYPFPLFAQRLSTGQILTGSTGYDPGLRLTKMSPDIFAFGHSGEYKISLMDVEGNILYCFKREEHPPQFSPEERRKFKNLPKDKPYFFELLTDSLERIYVQRNMAYGNIMVEVREKEVDVFDRMGRFLYRTWLPANTKVIRDGLLYCWELDEEGGMENVKRYRIINWDSIVRAK